MTEATELTEQRGVGMSVRNALKETNIRSLSSSYTLQIYHLKQHERDTVCGFARCGDERHREHSAKGRLNLLSRCNRSSYIKNCRSRQKCDINSGTPMKAKTQTRPTTNHARSKATQAVLLPLCLQQKRTVFGFVGKTSLSVDVRPRCQRCFLFACFSIDESERICFDILIGETVVID